MMKEDDHVEITKSPCKVIYWVDRKLEGNVWKRKTVGRSRKKK